MISKNKVDLLIVGGGVLGAFHAYHALRRGLTVLLLERHSQPQGASVRNFGQVVPSGMDPHWQALGRESLQIYQELQQLGDLSVRKLGSVYLASNSQEQTLIEELHQINRTNDYESQLLTATQCRSRFPELRQDYAVGGLFFPQELSVNPRMMIHRLHEYLSKESGFEARFETGIRQLQTDDTGDVVATATDGNSFFAAKAIVCCGSEFQSLYPDRFASSNLQVVKLQMLRLQPNIRVSLPGNILTGRSIRRYESFADCPSWEEIKAQETVDDFAHQWGIHILFKQEVDGSVILGDSHEYAPAAKADTLGFDLRWDINQFFIDEGRQIMNLPSWDVEASWMGVYSQTSDPSGIYLETVEPNIHIVTGIGGKGMTSSAGFAAKHLERLYND